MKKLILLLILINSLSLFPQDKGVVTGKVIDKVTNEELPGANVSVVNTNNGASTDIDGSFIIKNLPHGIYKLKISYLSYKTLLIENVVVSAEENNLLIHLEPMAAQLNEVVVTAEAYKNTESSLLKEQKNSIAMIDGLSAELISKNGGSTGIDVLKRMTGITISDGKYAYIRGVGDRYNSTMLNGANVPSTDPEKKSFSYDVFPSNVIETIVTAKTFTPDKPADFAGGLVQINTLEFPKNFIFHFEAGAAYNKNSNLNDFAIYNSGRNDFFKLGDGSRALPSEANGSKVTPGLYSTSELQSIGHSFANNWSTNNRKAPLNGSYKLTLGDILGLYGGELGYIASLSYSNTFDVKEQERNSYTFDDVRYNYKGYSYENNAALNGLLNISYRVDGNKISFKNIYTKNADDEVIKYSGGYRYADQYRDVTSLRYISRTLLSHQVLGEHNSDLLKLNWNLSYSNSKRNEPDAMRYIYSRDINSPEDPLRFQLDQSLTTKYFGKLNDDVYGANVDFLIKPFDDARMPSFKTGFMYDSKHRNFDARIFGFKNIPGGNFMAEDSILQLSVDKIFSRENINSSFIEVTEVTKPSDSYKSNQYIAAGYLMVDAYVTENFRVVGGIRYERSSQEMLSKTETGTPVNVKPVYNDYLPSLNLTYQLTPLINLRFAYSQTLARPEFREMAPFSYFDFTSNELVIGNPELKRSLVQNYDFRFEFFPGVNELASINLFYKKFSNPIEQVLIASSGFEPIRSYQNASSAFNYGAELELRKSLNFIADAFNDFSFVSNLTLIHSEIKVNSENFQESNRPLQGQADYIINTGLYYDNYEAGFQSSLTYNKVGENIAKVGYAGLGNVMQKARDQIDFSISKSLFQNFRLKLAVRDLLAQDRKLIQKMPGGDKLTELENRDRNFSVSLSYTF